MEIWRVKYAHKYASTIPQKPRLESAYRHTFARPNAVMLSPDPTLSPGAATRARERRRTPRRESARRVLSVN